jgi:hypothetical protein
MMNKKKIIGVSSALIITGVGMMSSASAISTMESTDGSSKTENGKANSMAEQRQENQKERAQMYQEIKTDRANMNQGIKDDKIKMQQENADNRQMGGGGMMKPSMGSGGELSTFLKNPLTPEERMGFKTLMDAHQAAREAIEKDTTLTREARATKMKELMTAHFSDLLVYIAADKQVAFKKAIEEKLAMMTKNQNNRQEFKEGAKEKRQEFKAQVQVEKQALSEKNRTQLEKAINTMTLEKLQTILARVAKVSAATKNERILSQLAEINVLIQDKIDAITGTSSEDTIVNDILGTNTSTNTNTTTSTVTQ